MRILVGFLFVLIFSLGMTAIDGRSRRMVILVSAVSVPQSSPAVAPITPIPSSMADFSPGHQTHSNKKLLIGLIAASSLIGLIILPLMCLWKCRRKKNHKSGKISTNGLDSLRGLPLSSFITRSNITLKPSNEKASVTVMDYNLLESATNNFRESDILGSGGFGCVYKAQLDDNLFVAVKRLDNHTRDAIKEFQVRYLEAVHQYCKRSYGEKLQVWQDDSHMDAIYLKASSHY